jgi:hypothetical protein
MSYPLPKMVTCKNEKQFENETANANTSIAVAGFALCLSRCSDATSPRRSAAGHLPPIIHHNGLYPHRLKPQTCKKCPFSKWNRPEPSAKIFHSEGRVTAAGHRPSPHIRIPIPTLSSPFKPSPIFHLRKRLSINSPQTSTNKNQARKIYGDDNHQPQYAPCHQSSPAMPGADHWPKTPGLSAISSAVASAKEEAMATAEIRVNQAIGERSKKGCNRRTFLWVAK